jgi:type IV secretory pathway VirB10-like protein
MGDPQRLLRSMHGDEELTRELLGSLRDVGPRPGAKDAAWKRIAVSTAAVATIGTGSAVVQALGRTGGVLATATKTLTAKVAIGLAIAGSTAGGGWALHERFAGSEPAPVKPAAHTASLPTANAPIAPAPMVEPAELAAPVAPPAEAVATPSHKAQERAVKTVDEGRARRDSLALESRMLTEARAQLHAGDPRGALATLDKLRARSPKGMLTQERDVLAIQILSSLGDATAAKQKAKEFLDAYPESPHAPQLRRLASGG